MAIRKMVVRPGQKPTEEQRKRIRRAASLPITYDEDCPELTEEQYEMFARIAAKQRAGRKKRLYPFLQEISSRRDWKTTVVQI